MWLRKSRWCITILFDSVKITRIKTHIFSGWKGELILFILHLRNGILRAGVVRKTRLTAIDYAVSSIFYHHLCVLISGLMYSAKLSSECTCDDGVIIFFLNRLLIHQTVWGKRLRVLILELFLSLFLGQLFFVTFSSFSLERILFLLLLLIRCGVNYAFILSSRLFEIIAILLTFQALETVASHFFVLLRYLLIIKYMRKYHKILSWNEFFI